MTELGYAWSMDTTTRLLSPKAGFHTYLDVREHPSGDQEWRLLGDLEYHGNTEHWIVPRGFTTDFASVPSIFRSLVSRIGRHTKAAVVHDWLYVEQPEGVSRKDADGLFRRAMKGLGVGWWRRNAAYYAVRVGGGAAWKRSAARKAGELRV